MMLNEFEEGGKEGKNYGFKLREAVLLYVVLGRTVLLVVRPTVGYSRSYAPTEIISIYDSDTYWQRNHPRGYGYGCYRYSY